MLWAVGNCPERRQVNKILLTPVHGILATCWGLAALAWPAQRAIAEPAAAQSIDSAGFYARQPGQVFKGIAPADMTLGFLPGQGTPYQTWQGQVGHMPLYVELHGAQLRIQVGRRWIRRALASAIRLPAEPMAELDPKGTALYVRAGQAGKPSVLCLESLNPDAFRVVPLRSVYVVTNLSGHSPRLHQLPALYGACKGLRQTTSGPLADLAAPRWSASGSPGHAGYQIRYVRLAAQALIPEGPAFTATQVGESQDQFTITEP